ncbi:GDSL-type esterase/lipase family protein [Glaciibacter superstes]|uniref:GDSL-type esterase/lipase family protein n=1 Tax=Glaciibacter superstes TaxID=501023 RepID=UPI0003B503F3|nr:GDSL-type esterase/lipase family protein [Glaciibacter superstes]
MSGSIAFVGDGLTANGRWEEWFQEYGVHNFGVSGDTSDRVIARLESIVELQPDAISLQIGTNDLGRHRSDEYIVRNIETILWELRRQLPDVLILIQSVMPRERDYAETIRSINRHLWQFAPTQRARYLDLWPAMAQSDGELIADYTEDRLHLTDAGYGAWTTELKTAIEMLFERPPSSSSIPIQRA